MSPELTSTLQGALEHLALSVALEPTGRRPADVWDLDERAALLEPHAAAVAATLDVVEACVAHAVNTEAGARLRPTEAAHAVDPTVFVLRSTGHG